MILFDKIYVSIEMFGRKRSLYTYFFVSSHIAVASLKYSFRKMVYDDAVDTHAYHDWINLTAPFIIGRWMTIMYTDTQIK